MNEALKKPEKYRKKYMNKHKMLTLILNNDRDKDIIEWLDKQENKSAAVRAAIRTEIRYVEIIKE